MPLKHPGETVAPYHVLSIEGPAKSSKTFLAAQGPKKMVWQSTDHGWDGVIQKIEGYDPKDFLVADYYYNVDVTADELFKDKATMDAGRELADKQALDVTNKVWKPFRKDYETGLALPAVRSVTWDLADEHYDHLRLANFGKLERNSQLGYVGVNAEYLGLIRLAHQYQKNLFLIHQLADVYKEVVDENGKSKSVKSGELRRKGPASVPYLVHSFVRTGFEPAVRKPNGEIEREMRFLVKILSARLNPRENGRILVNPDLPTLMSYLAPDMDLAKWMGL